MHKPSQWSRFLHLAEFWYNSSHYSAIGMSPFEATYVRPPPPLFRDANFSPTLKATTDYHETHNAIIDKLKMNLGCVRKQMKTRADKGHADVQFDVGDRVFVKLHKYRQNSVAQRCSSKLDRCYFGPFLIIARVSSVAYKLDHPPQSRIHDVFHISLPKNEPQRRSTIYFIP